MENVLSIQDVSKKYGDFYALKNINLEMNNGIYAVLGLNGAGKTTLINLITDNAVRTSGKIMYNGTEIKKLGAKYRSILGYMPQEQGIYHEFTGREYLLYIAGLKGIKSKKDKVNKLLVQFNLVEKADEKIGSYSGGMRQRIVLAQAMLNDPYILILDEPTTGLDPVERNRFKDYIKDLSKGKIIIYCTHIISDIEDVADKVIIMKKGELRIILSRQDIEGMKQDNLEKNAVEYMQ